MTLGATEPSERAAGHGRGVDRSTVDAGVRDPVGPSDRQVHVPEDLVRRVVVGACVEIDVGFERGDVTGGGGAESEPDAAAMSFVVADDRLFA